MFCIFFHTVLPYCWEHCSKLQVRRHIVMFYGRSPMACLLLCHASYMKQLRRLQIKHGQRSDLQRHICHVLPTHSIAPGALSAHLRQSWKRSLVIVAQYSAQLLSVRRSCAIFPLRERRRLSGSLLPAGTARLIRRTSGV